MQGVTAIQRGQKQALIIDSPKKMYVSRKKQINPKKKKKNSVCKFYEKIITGFILPDNLFDRIASKKGHGSIRLVFNWTRRCYSSVSVMFAVFAPKLPSTDSCEMVRSSILVSPL